MQRRLALSPRGLLLAVGLIAGGLGLLPPRMAAVAAGLTCIVWAILALLLREKAGRWSGWALLLACLVGMASWLELRPLPSPDEVLGLGMRNVQTRWAQWLNVLDATVTAWPEQGGGFPELEERRRRLDQGSGLALIRAADGKAEAWAGWTTPMDLEELDVFLDRAAVGPGVIVLRRGLSMRLLYGRYLEGDPQRLLVAEVPLFPEEERGPIGVTMGSGLVGRVSWEASGAGLRPPISERREVGPGEALGQRAFWSLDTLMVDERWLVARVSYGILPQEEQRDAIRDLRRTIVAIILALTLCVLAITGKGPLLLEILAARALLFIPVPRLFSGALHDGGVMQALIPGGPVGPFGRLVATPWDAALTALALLALAALMPVSKSKLWRAVLASCGAILTVVGLVLSHLLTLESGLSPGELVLPAEDLRLRIAVALVFVTPAWIGLMLLGRAWKPKRGSVFIVTGVLAGVLAGATHAAALVDAAERRVMRSVLPESAERVQIWQRAIDETLQMAVPLVESAKLTPDRDAIDLWWNSPLGRLGLRCAIFKWDRDGRLLDAFLTGVPPISIAGELVAGTTLPDEATGLYRREVIEATQRMVMLVYDPVHIISAEVRRPEGGSWVVAVLDEPFNLPSLNRRDPLRGAQAFTPAALSLEPAALEPRLSFFDEGGNLLWSDFDAGPAPPHVVPKEAEWKDLVVEGRSARGLVFPTDAGSAVAVVLEPALLEWIAVPLGWMFAIGALAALAVALRSILSSPVSTLQQVQRGLLMLTTHFRVQVALVLTLAGLLPLLVFGSVDRTSSRQQATRQLESDSAELSQVARHLIESWVRVTPLETPEEHDALTDADVSWLSSNIGEDLFIWNRGRLLATSRRDLVRAGLWPPRLPGSVWQDLAARREPMVVESLGGVAARRPFAWTVAHGPFLAAPDHVDVFSIPLARTSERIEENLRNADRALLFCAALLLAIGGTFILPATRRFVGPLATLEQATSRLAAGQFETPLPKTGYAETLALSRAFETMARALEAKQNSLERRRAAIEALIDSMPIAVLALGAGGVVRTANQRAIDLLGARLGTPLPNAEDPLTEKTLELASHEETSQATVDRPGGDRSERYRIAAFALPGLWEGEAARVVVIEDLTDAVRSERLSAWAEMARRIAHEIKNPLTPISLIVEHLRRLSKQNDPDLPVLLERCLASISDQVRVLRETSREFSDYARILVAHPEPLDLAEQIERWLAPHELAPPDGITFHREISADLPAIEADPRLLRRAVTNLVDNAVTVLQGSGTITVSCRYEAEPESVVRIAVEDNGPGIEDDRLAMLFEPDVTTRETGSGLGLPIARQAVEAQGGRIEVEGRFGRGARFSIVLPVKE